MTTKMLKEINENLKTINQAQAARIRVLETLVDSVAWSNVDRKEKNFIQLTYMVDVETIKHCAEPGKFIESYCTHHNFKT